MIARCASSAAIYAKIFSAHASLAVWRFIIRPPAQEAIMLTITALKPRQDEELLPTPRARIGMIIPSVNSMTEPQFNHFAPPGLGVHVARARVAGEWKRPLAAMADEIATSAKLLADVAPDLIVFHCTDTSMTQGPRGEGDILKIVQDATGIEALATRRLVLDALQALGLRSPILLSPSKR